VVKAYARNGGYDEAYLTGSAEDDRLYGYQEYAYLDGPGYYHYAELFDYVEADGAGHVGGDRADLYDSKLAADDTFTGHSTPGHVGRMDYAGGNSINASNFEFGYARAPVDYADTDTANLHSGTLWNEIGDWEVVNNLGPGVPGSTALDLDFARWIARTAKRVPAATESPRKSTLPAWTTSSTSSATGVDFRKALAILGGSAGRHAG